MSDLNVRAGTLEDLLLHNGARDPVSWIILRQMHDKGHFWVLRDGKTYVAMMGVHPVMEGAGEVWFDQSSIASRYVHQFLHHARLTLADLPYALLVIPNPNKTGQILARRLGFADEGNNIWMR